MPREVECKPYVPSDERLGSFESDVEEILQGGRSSLRDNTFINLEIVRDKYSGKNRRRNLERLLELSPWNEIGEAKVFVEQHASSSIAVTPVESVDGSKVVVMVLGTTADFGAYEHKKWWRERIAPRIKDLMDDS